MKVEKTPHEPRQERSRATVESLLNATVELLDQSGLEGAVIPRIAEVAGMAPANVYRRFADKNALLRAAFLHALTQSNQANLQLLQAQLLGDSLAATARKLVNLLFDQYRQHPRFLRALSRFVDADSDQEFVRKVRVILGANVDLLVDVLLTHRSEIQQASPERAVRFAVLHATCSIEAFTLDPQSIWHVEPSISCEELTDRLVHSFVTHLTMGGQSGRGDTMA
jgi:AcrR family transcriptional regulator